MAFTSFLSQSVDIEMLTWDANIYWREAQKCTCLDETRSQQYFGNIRRLQSNLIPTKHTLSQYSQNVPTLQIDSSQYLVSTNNVTHSNF